MIKFQKLTIKNFLSYGNTPTTFFLDKSHTTLITGKNGEGKCFTLNTVIRLRNKETGEVFETTIGEFYESMSQEEQEYR